MLLVNKPKPPSFGFSGLTYWWPLDDFRSGGQIAKELVQGLHAFPSGGTIYSGFPQTGRWPVTPGSNKINTPRFLEQAGSLHTTGNITVPHPRFTLSLWFQYPTGPTNYGALFTSSGTSRFEFYVKLGSIRWYSGVDFADPSGVAPTVNVPNHVTWSFDGANYHIVFNGNLVSTVGGSGAGAGTAVPANMGGSIDLPFLYDVRLYNRALSIGESKQIWTEGYSPPPLTIEETALVGGFGGVQPLPSYPMPELTTPVRFRTRMVGY